MLTSGSSKACASCKYQRRKCTKDCLLAPYFPSDQPRIFRNARRLFGVSNMHKLLTKVDPSRRDKAMETMIYEANMRAVDPVYGCVSVARHYQGMVLLLTKELQHVRNQIAQCKELFHHQNYTHEGGPPPRQSDVNESPVLHRDADCGFFASMIDDYDFDAVQLKYDQWILGHGQVNFEAADDHIDGTYNAGCVMTSASDGHQQSYNDMDSRKSSLSSSCSNSSCETSTPMQCTKQLSPAKLQSMETPADFGTHNHVKNEFASQVLIFNRASALEEE